MMRGQSSSNQSINGAMALHEMNAAQFQMQLRRPTHPNNGGGGGKDRANGSLKQIKGNSSARTTRRNQLSNRNETPGDPKPKYQHGYLLKPKIIDENNKGKNNICVDREEFMTHHV